MCWVRTVEYYSALKNDLLIDTRMSVKIILWSERSLTKTNESISVYIPPRECKSVYKDRHRIGAGGGDGQGRAEGMKRWHKERLLAHALVLHGPFVLCS